MRRFALVALALASLTSVALAEVTRAELQDALQKHPDLVIDALKLHKRALYQLIEEAAREEQSRRQAQEEERESKAFEDSFKNPLKPEIGEHHLIRGPKDAKLTLVEYSDFQCPYCSRGYSTVKTLEKKHAEELRFVYKHLPLNFHPQAMPAALWVQAAAAQSPEKAWKLHDALYENQDKLGEEFFKSKAAELGLDTERLHKDVKSDRVQSLVEADMEEAKKFGFSGTPGFLLNGVPVRGAYPPEHFEKIIDRLKL